MGLDPRIYRHKRKKAPRALKLPKSKFQQNKIYETDAEEPMETRHPFSSTRSIDLRVWALDFSGKKA